MSKGELVKFDENVLKDRIYSIRGYQVMLDSDLAELYGVETKVLNQAVKRNIERFPPEFCFSLNNSEIRSLRSQIILSERGGRRYNYLVFTEHGVSMLASILNSKAAIEVSIKIIDAFIEMRKFIQANGQIFQRLDRVEVKLLGRINILHNYFVFFILIKNCFLSNGDKKWEKRR